MIALEEAQLGLLASGLGAACAPRRRRCGPGAGGRPREGGRAGGRGFGREAEPRRRSLTGFYSVR